MDEIRRFRFRARVAHHEVGAFGDVRPSGIVRLLQEAAIEASTDAGFSAAWYVAAGTQWIVRRTALEVEDALRGGESVVVTTSVADFRRVLSRRRYEIRGDDDRLVASGWSDWVYLDVARGRPKRVEPDMIAAFLGGGEGEAVERTPIEVGDPPPHAHRSAHAIVLGDLDGFAHLNNAAAIDLLEESFASALERGGHPLERLLGEGVVPRLRTLDVEYLSEAQHGDQVDVAVWGAPDAAGRTATSFVATVAGRDGTTTQARATWSWIDRATGRERPGPPVRLGAPQRYW